tara:strand:- start:99 stop:380 length:282 start_codon:yes stop_codon:yes gene_type:complete
MRESRDNYIIRKIKEERMNKLVTSTSISFSLKPTSLSTTEIDIYKKNIADLQEQLQNSYIKQKLFLNKLNELQKRRTISLVNERKQLNFDFSL